MGWLAQLWTAPNTLFGLLLALGSLAGGGTMRVSSGAIEAEGPLARLLLGRLPFVGRAAAITFGQVVLGTDRATLEASRAHERVHVRQYLRWGPLFIPAYLVASAAAWLRGGHPYRDNRFEREAYAAETRGRVRP